MVALRRTVRGGKPMMNKLRRCGGETLVETLVAVLIVTLSVLFLTTASVSAAKINHSTSEVDTAFHVADSPDRTITVTVKTGSGATVLTKEADLYISSNTTDSEKDDYVYYRVPEVTP